MESFLRLPLGGLSIESILSSLLACLLFGLLFLFYTNTSNWLYSQWQRRKLTSQGIRGPPYSILHGNVPEMQKIQSMAATLAPKFNAEIVAHDYTSTLFPYFEQWRKEYGTARYSPMSLFSPFILSFQNSSN
ncbi:hypothetical protein Dimus_022360 [Dionaea muscipula]